MYVMLCFRLDISYAIGVVSRYQSNPSMAHWTSVKLILKYLRRTRDYVLVYHGDNLTPLGYTDSDFPSDKNERKCAFGYVFTLARSAVSWRSVKQSCIAYAIVEAKYVTASEACKEAVWLRKFLMDLGVVPIVQNSIIIYCDNSGAMAIFMDPKSHKK